MIPRRVVRIEGQGDTIVRDVPGPPGAPTLLLLHGLGATAAMNWGPCFGPLSERFRVLSIDHRGHGRGLRTQRFSLEQCADDAMAIAAACGAGQMIVVGWSMGGMIASLAWRRHRDRVGALVLCATGRSFVAKPTARAVQAAYPAVAGFARLAPGLAREGLIRRSAGARTEAEARARVRREYAGHDPLALAMAVKALSEFSAHEWIGEVDVPTACIVTTRDGVVPASRQRRLAAAIPGAELFEIEGDHSTCVSQSDRFVTTLLDACRNVERRMAGPAARARL